MDGLLIIDKPAGITSHDVVSRVRRILGTRRVGHTGTLDPFATGVMVVLIGRATRLAQFVDKDEKEYEATIQFGFETDTADATGERNAERGMRNEEVVAKLNATDWEAVLTPFRGKIEQRPPMYSAKKVGGKKLYESARKGIEVERKAQSIEVRELEVIGDSALQTPHSAFQIKVVCSAGTYIRTLAEDIGRAVGVGAHLTELRRTRSGRFDLTRALSIDDLSALDDPKSALLPIDLAVEHLPVYTVPLHRFERTIQGLSSRVEDTTFAEGQAIRMTSPDGELLAIGTYIGGEASIKPKVVLV